MSRKIALITAGMFTGIIAGVLLIFPFSNEVQANDALEIPPPIVVVDTSNEQQLSEFEAALAAREAALQDQLAQRQTTIITLDETYQNQFTALEGRLEEANSKRAGASERVEALQKEAERIQEEIVAADEAFQEEMSGLQNGLSYKDSQMRQEIERVYAQLQQAYDQIAAQEALAVASGNGSSSSSGDNRVHDDSDKGDHDDDHDGGDDNDHDSGDDNDHDGGDDNDHDDD